MKRLLGWLRRFKPAWVFYNLAHWRQLRNNSDRYKQLGIRKSVLGSVSHREITQPSADTPWLDRPDAAEALAKADTSQFPEGVRAQFPNWLDEGFVVLEGHLSGAEVEEINTDIERLFESGEVEYHFRSPRVENAFEKSEPINRFLHDPKLTGVLDFLLGRKVELFQTINFFQGSQQAAHSDSFHMTTEPLGNLIAIWVALEDVDSESGPIFYYPGSHRLPYVMSEDLGANGSALFLADGKDELYEQKIGQVVKDAGIEPVDFLPNKGDVFIWHANLVHGGRPIKRDGATRKSLVAHYFATGVLCYHEVTERPALVAA
jgi:ectoine hydroxylase